MKRSDLLLFFFSALIVVLTAGAGLAQDVASPVTSVPTFMNGEIVRVDTVGQTLLIRSESSRSLLHVEGRALVGLGGWHAGDKVIVGYRTVVDSLGRPVRFVTELLSASAASGTPAIVRTSNTTRIVRVSNTSQATATVPVRTVRRLRVAAVDRKANRLTVTDAAGNRGLIRVQGAAAVRSLGRTRPGDVVSVTLTTARRRTTGTTTTVVTEIQALPPDTALDQAVMVNPTPVVASPAASVVITPAASAPAPVVPAAPVVGVSTAPRVTVPGIVGPVSMFDYGVPSVPPTAPSVNAPLPPATAGLSESDDVGAMRQKGLRDLQAAAGTLALKANEIDGAWSRFKNVCLTAPLPDTTLEREWFLVFDSSRLPVQTIDGCRVMHNDLMRMAAAFDEQFTIVGNAARQADVAPGTIRTVWSRNRLDH